MNKAYRRYELLLPLRFNDGTPVPEELRAEVLIELERQFGAVWWESQTIYGQWTFQGQAYRDELIRAFIDVPDNDDNRQFFVALKEKLKARFQRLDIWVTTHPLEIL